MRIVNGKWKTDTGSGENQKLEVSEPVTVDQLFVSALEQAALTIQQKQAGPSMPSPSM